MDNPILIGVVAMLALIFFLMSGIWIAVGMGIVAIAALYVFQTSPALMSHLPFGISNSFVMTAIPLFIFMGSILQHCGASEMIYRGASKWLAWAPGGLFHSNIGSCSLFAAISGSSIATLATIGTMAIPSLKKRGYDEKIALGSLACAGTLGVLIPPSITMIVYGSIATASVGRLFAGGIIPGLMLSLMFMIYIAIRALRNPQLAPKEATFSIRGLLSGFVDLWPIFVLMFIVLGGIFTGFVSPTEAAALGASAALLIALALRQLTWQGFRDSLLAAVRTTCMLLFIIIGATMLGSVLGRVGTAKALARFIMSLNASVIGVVLAVVLLYLVLGCFMEGLAMMVVTMPVLIPALEAVGVDLVWFGVLVVVLLELGLLTPPVGLSLYVIQGISHSDFGTVFKGTMPFFFIHLTGLGLLIAFPPLILWLPSLIFGS